MWLFDDAYSFLSHGLVSNLGGAFSNLATSMMSHMQGSSMSVAAEAASASFGLGQTSFYNTTANNFSANKHDSNWTHLHGMRTSQLGSGVLKTITGSGDRVFDVSPGMTRSAVSINALEGLSASLNQAYEQSTQAARNESAHYQNSLSNFAHRACNYHNWQGMTCVWEIAYRKVRQVNTPKPYQPLAILQRMWRDA
ncbi:hypothetical protein PGH45_20170 [Legionella pneumophila]|nr:hypothetical protein [Legionella pneumophila]